LFVDVGLRGLLLGTFEFVGAVVFSQGGDAKKELCKGSFAIVLITLGKKC
jgi:hypothetical protein